MNSTIEVAFLGVASLLTGSISGGVAAKYLGQIADSVSPDWVGALAGPLGSIVGMGIAVGWLVKFVKELQTKHDKQQEQFLELLKSTTIALTVSSGAISEAKLAIQRADVTYEELMEIIKQINTKPQ